MDKKKLIAVVGAGLLFVAGLFMKEDVKGLVCGAPAAQVEAK
jgi:hypothetical protein